MKSTAALWLIISALALSGCGGGGSGGGGTESSSASSISSATPITLSITAGNQQSVLGISAFYRSYLEAFALDSTSFFLGMRELGKSDLTLTCSAGGNLVLTVNSSSTQMTAAYQQCSEGGVTADGIFTYDIQSFTDTGSQQNLALKLSTSSLSFSFSTSGQSIAISGDQVVTLATTSSSGVMSITSGNFAFSAISFNGSVRNYSETLSNNYSSGTYSLAFAGWIQDSDLGGAFSFSVSPPFTGSFKSYPETGLLTFTGANNTSARLAPGTPAIGYGYPNEFTLQAYAGSTASESAWVGVWSGYFSPYEFVPMDSDATVPATPPTLTVATSNLAVTMDTSDSNPATYQNINFNIKNPPDTQLYVSATVGRTAINSVSAYVDQAPSSGIGVTPGSVTAVLYSPGTMGSGTYTDTITLRVCSDANCNQQIANSPIQIPVTYTVTGDPKPYGGIYATTTNIKIEANSDQNVTNTATLPFSLSYSAPYPLTYVVTPGTGNTVTTASTSSGTYGQTIDVTMRSPASFTPGDYQDTLQLKVCKDAACTVQIDGSPLTFNLTYSVPAVLGRDFTMTQFAQNAAEVAWNSATQRVLVSSTYLNAGGKIREIDPMTGAEARSISLSNWAHQLVVTADGQYAYFVQLKASGACCVISRLRLSDFVVDQTIDITGYSDYETIVAPAPNSPQTIAVSYLGLNGQRVEIYDNATLRSQSLSVFTGSSGTFDIVWGDTQSTLYVATYSPYSFSRYSVTNSGIASSPSASYTGSQAVQFQSRLINYGGKIFAATGAIFDPINMTSSGAFDLSTARSASAINDALIRISPTANRAYFEFTDYDGNQLLSTLKVFSTTNLTSVGHLRLDQFGAGGTISTCGNQCLVTGNTEKLTFLRGTFIGQ